MTAATTDLPISEAVLERAALIYGETMNTVHRRVDRMFATLLIVQWAGGVAVTLFLSAATWDGPVRSTHLHIYASLFLGGALTIFPFFLALRRPGERTTRMILAAAQMLWSGLLIHLTGGRLETHFHIFGSLAFLAFYRDAYVLLPATVIVVLDHLIRGIVWPESIYGVANPEWWRFLEHGGWVLFINFFLIRNCLESESDMACLAERQAELEASAARQRTLSDGLEVQVLSRTAELCTANTVLHVTLEDLRQRESFLSAVMSSTADPIITIDEEKRIVACSDSLAEVTGHTIAELVGSDISLVVPGLVDESADAQGQRVERDIARKDGELFPAVLAVRRVACDGENLCIIVMHDLRPAKQAEERMRDLSENLILASRKAGMAEVASGVLHNIGNILNSVNVSAYRIRQTARESKLDRIASVSALLDRKGPDLADFLSQDPRGKLVQPYLVELASQLGVERCVLIEEATNLESGIEHIKTIVSKQQLMAKTGGVPETCRPRDLLDDALRLQETSLDRHAISLTTEFTDIPELIFDRHMVLQILFNLLRNAVEAIKMRSTPDPGRTLRVAASYEGGVLELTVSDTGVGISEEAMERLFSYGYTTKPTGHGFGLHNSALMAQEMGGSLTAVSDGIGLGATFTLKLPARAARRAA